MSKKKARIRLATEKDLPEICYVQKQAWLRSHVSPENGFTEEFLFKAFADCDAQKESWRQAMVVPKTVMLVAEMHNSIVGYIYAFNRFEEHGYVYIHALFVDPDCHRQGVGRSLLEAVLQNWPEVPQCVLRVASFNDDAIQFYKALGFEIYDNPNSTKDAFGKKLPVISMYRDAPEEAGDA